MSPNTKTACIAKNDSTLNGQSAEFENTDQVWPWFDLDKMAVFETHLVSSDTQSH